MFISPENTSNSITAYWYKLHTFEVESQDAVIRMLFFQITDETAKSYEIILIQVHVYKYSILIYALITIKASHRWNGN